MPYFEKSSIQTQAGRFACFALLATVFAFLPQSASAQPPVVLDWQAGLANAGAGPHPMAWVETAGMALALRLPRTG
jgi:hypothetical protein